jgi:hypothetical protein
VPYVTRSCPDRPHLDHHCPAMTGALRRTLPLRVLPGILPGSHRLGPDPLRLIRLVLVRMCRILDRNSAPVPPSHHPHRRNLRRFGVHGCPEVVQARH